MKYDSWIVVRGRFFRCHVITHLPHSDAVVHFGRIVNVEHLQSFVKAVIHRKDYVEWIGFFMRYYDDCLDVCYALSIRKGPALRSLNSHQTWSQSHSMDRKNEKEWDQIWTAQQSWGIFWAGAMNFTNGMVKSSSICFWVDLVLNETWLNGRCTILMDLRRGTRSTGKIAFEICWRTSRIIGCSVIMRSVSVAMSSELFNRLS
jgi:hypothetical protein